MKLSLLLLFASVACQFDRPADVRSPDARPVDANVPGLEIVPIPATWVRLDGETTISVVLSRDPAVAPASVHVSVETLAPGIVAEPLVIGPESSQGELVVRALSAQGAVATQGLPLRVIAASATGVADASVDLAIAGPAGSVDEQFGAAGLAALGVGDGGGMFRHANGLVVVGSDRLSHFDRSGRIDAAFADGGTYTPIFSGIVGPARVFAASLSTGAIIVVGNGNGESVGTPRDDIFLQRLTPSGLRDPTFSETRERLLESFRVSFVSPGENGAFFVGGIAWGDVGNSLVIRKFDVRGTLDQSFGTDGSIQLSSAAQYTLDAMIVLPDDRLLVAWTQNDEVLRVTRWTASGALDLGFAEGGSFQLNAHVSTTPVFARAFGLGVDASGQPLIAGWFAPAATFDFRPYLVRLTVDGAPDSSWDGDGTWSPPGLGVNAAASATSLGDGSLLVAGATAPTAGGPLSAQLYHLSDDGVAIPDFGPEGTADLDFPFSPSGQAFVDSTTRGWFVGGTSAGRPAVVRLWY
ncbi:MAG: hypothetical protein R3B06_22375 [Kofleriaceae bacterium]